MEWGRAAKSPKLLQFGTGLRPAAMLLARKMFLPPDLLPTTFGYIHSSRLPPYTRKLASLNCSDGS